MASYLLIRLDDTNNSDHTKRWLCDTFQGTCNSFVPYRHIVRQFYVQSKTKGFVGYLVTEMNILVNLKTLSEFALSEHPVAFVQCGDIILLCHYLSNA